jgi:hypothetical protein
MAIVQDALYEQEYNCLTTDLVDGFPSSTDYELGAVLYAYDSTTKLLDSIYKLHDSSGAKAWYKIYSAT